MSARDELLLDAFKLALRYSTLRDAVFSPVTTVSSDSAVGKIRHACEFYGIDENDIDNAR